MAVASLSGAANVLSTDDYGSAWVKKRLQEFSDLFEEFASDNPKERGCQPVYLGPSEPDFALFDPSTRGPAGEMQVLSFDLTEEVGRFDSFRAYLLNRLKMKTSIIEDELKGRAD